MRADTTRFSYPEVKVGFSGGLITNLATRIPHKIAMELLLVGEPIDAQRAYEVGYVNKIVPAAELMSTAIEWASADRRHRAAAVARAEALRRGGPAQGPDRDRRHRPRPDRRQSSRSADWEEGRSAFVEKRPPIYTGK